MSKADVYSSKGIKGGSLNLPKDFSEKENFRLLAQAIRVYNENLHIGIAKVKTRAEVDRTKKKIYKQKGTGGARHGSRSAPIYVGGGVAHGPKPYSRKLVLPKRLAKKALNVALSLKAKENKIVVVSGLGGVGKTKDIMAFINKFRKAEGKKTRFTFALSQENQKQSRNLTNITGVNAVPFRNLNAYRVFFGGILVLDKEIFDKVKSQNSKVKTAKEETKK